MIKNQFAAQAQSIGYFVIIIAYFKRIFTLSVKLA